MLSDGVLQHKLRVMWCKVMEASKHSAKDWSAHWQGSRISGNCRNRSAKGRRCIGETIGEYKGHWASNKALKSWAKLPPRPTAASAHIDHAGRLRCLQCLC